ncbi:hypothetical protein PRK78_006756 [Emydomyces testavorans]|uniref:Uncharacterized protein n=1 Tax=Emydomyces testavorans TaxID=2070801 RepID=A0AAF0DPT8_9EURO|nr:hypothetical protein PRK78_006756 [Emydomyces testavorans]
MKIKSEEEYAKIGDPVMLDKVDKLFECNVGDLVDLPQLVVVGDQSSGKSSVLAGLTKLPFPRDSGLCTRFATQIIFRRAIVKSIKVSILPGPNSSPEHAESVKRWHIAVEKLDASSFTKILSEAHGVMNLSTQETKGNHGLSTFSEDVLRLEIEGPNEAHLSVIDVPGLFTNTTEGVTSKKDIQIVRDMVLRYMKNPRSVMLVVVPANVDIATQAILQHAKELDPAGERTLGVFTKPDLVDKGAETAVMDALAGKRSGIKLGWNVVRNPGQQDLSEGKIDRDSEETFFKEVSPWNTLDKDKLGIESLRIRLQEILTSHIRREFPKVKSEILKKLKACNKKLESLGAERINPEQQAAFILNIATKFQDIVNRALATNYGCDDLFDEDLNLRLATVLVHREEDFATTMEQWGQEYYFNSEGEQVEHVDAADDPPELEKAKDLRTTEDPGDLGDILHDQGKVVEPRKLILKWIESVYRDSKGFEMGTFSPSLLPTIMKRQSSKWRAISLGYVSDVVVFVHQFISKVLKAICVDERVHLSLLDHLMDELIAIYKSTLQHVRFLLSVELTGILRTADPRFNENLSKLDPHPMSNAQNAVQDIHDILKSYYEVARHRFTDAVIMQAAHYHLLTGPETPLRLLSPAYVQRLTPDMLESIAGEDPVLRRTRSQLKKEIEELEAARKILR